MRNRVEGGRTWVGGEGGRTLAYCSAVYNSAIFVNAINYPVGRAVLVVSASLCVEVAQA